MFGVSSVFISSLPRQIGTPAARGVVGHDAAAETEVAHRVVGHRAPARRQQRDVGLVDPDGVDHQHALVQEAELVDVAHERLAVLRLAEHALELGLEDVDVERQVVAPGERGDRGEIVGRHALRRGAGHRGAEAAVRLAVPAVDEMVVESEQLRGRLPRRAVHRAALRLGQQIGEEGVLLVLDDVRLVDRDRRADAGVLVRPHDRVDRLAGRDRDVIRVVVHRGDPAAEHLERAEHRADVYEPFPVARRCERRHLVEHEELERQAGQGAFHEVAG
jgi:hypothetical protein